MAHTGGMTDLVPVFTPPLGVKSNGQYMQLPTTADHWLLERVTGGRPGILRDDDGDQQTLDIEYSPTLQKT